MKLSQLIIAAGVIAACSVTGPAIAHDRQHHDDRLHAQHSPIKRMLAGVDLTDGQREQIKQLVQQHRAAQQAERQDKAVQQQLRQLLSAEQFDETAVRELLQQQQQQHTEQRLSILKLQHQVRQLLTDDQRTQLDEKRQKWQQKRQQRHSS
jgi:periplasmic protein CpxP/Spy